MSMSYIRFGRAAAAGAVALFGARVSWGEVSVYHDRVEFAAATGAEDLAALPNVGVVAGARFEHEGLTITASAFYVGTGTDEDWTELLEGNDIAISGPENLNIDLAEPAAAIGFGFVDGTRSTGTSFVACNDQCPCEASPFDFRLLRGGAEVGTGSFDVPQETAGFVGIASTVPFDRVEFRDRRGGCDNEYWGAFSLAGAGCRPDCNGDGKLNVNDFICFQAEWRKKSAYGDYNGDGKWNINDFIAFQADFRKGCT